jgi:glycerophosphoryl diester phosphodiesterase
MKRFSRAALVALILFAAFCFFNNTNLFVAGKPGRPPLLAHRGLAQTFDVAGVENDTCTASRIHPPGHIWTNRIDRIAPLVEAMR